MKRSRKATIVFYDKNHFLIQDRRKISKGGEEYGFFGGGIEEGENAEEALKREMKEELEIEVKAKLFRHDIIFIKEADKEIERNVFIAEMPDLKSLRVNEGALKLIDINPLPNLKMVSGDMELLNEIKEYLGK